MIGAVENVYSTTKEARCGKVEYSPMLPGTGLFDATADGGRPRQCHAKEWFFTGVVFALGAVASLAAAIL